MRGSALSTQHSAFSRLAAISAQHLAVSRGSIWLWRRVTALVAVVREALREIFDEAAYARFLARHQLANSPAAYAHFLEERDPARKPRCC